jgi:hypothetical protein
VVFLTHSRFRVAELCVVVLLAQGALFAQAAGEYEIKAAFLYKFAGFVQWPEDAGGGPVCLGVMGQDPFGAALEDAVRGKTVNGRPFLIRRFQKPADPGPCQIVFISASERERVKLVLSHLQPAVLTVGDMPGFCESGGIIGFDLLERRVRLRINLEAAQRARLRLSSKLLSLAKLVTDGMQ